MLRVLEIFLMIATFVQAIVSPHAAADERPLCSRDMGSNASLLGANDSLLLVATPDAQQIHAVALSTCEVIWTAGTVGAAGGTTAFGSYVTVEDMSLFDTSSVYTSSMVSDESDNSGTITVESFDLQTGALRWTHSFADVVGKLSLFDGRLYVLGDSNLLAIDSLTGNVLWTEPITYSGVTWMLDLNVQFSGGRLAYFTIYDADPTDVGPPPYDLPLTDNIAAVVALDPATGERIWSEQMPQMNYYWLSASPDNSFMFVGSQMYREHEEDHKVIRLSAADGSRIWVQDIEETFDVLESDTQTAVLVDNPDQERSEFVVFDRETGERQLVHQIASEAWPVLLTKDYLLLEYFFGDDFDRAEPRTFVALSLDDGSELWSAYPSGTAGYGDMILAASDTTIYMVIGNSLTVVDSTNGAIFWVKQFEDEGHPTDMLLTSDSVVLAHAGSVITVFRA